MELHTYQRADAFLEAAGPTLELRETENSLMLGIAQRVAANPDGCAAPPFLATVRDEQGIVLAALMTPPWPVLLSAPRPSDEAVSLVRACLREGDWPVHGVTAPPALAAAFAEGWTADTGCTAEAAVATRVHELTEVSPVAYSPGAFVQAGPEHLDLLVAWTLAFSEEAMPDDPRDEEHIRAATEARIAAGDIALWVDGAPVSTALRSRPMARSVSIGGVYTPPELRGRGYATSCVARLSQAILDSGKPFCYLFTDLANPTSNKIYARIGYRPVADFQQYRFRARPTE